MELRLSKLILWSTNTGFDPRIIRFDPEKINIITGEPGKGKSAILWIIDYCLASKYCKIPIDIRKAVGWFGIELKSGERTILIARASPDASGTGMDFLLLEEPHEIPKVVEKNLSFDQVKNFLNDFADLRSVNLAEKFDQAIPSFRDTLSFNLQPQYLIANQSTLFYKADSLEHRRKLKSTFPFFLGAESISSILAKDRLLGLNGELKHYLREKEAYLKHEREFLGELRGIYAQAKKYGLLRKRPDALEDWEAQTFLEYLSEISNAVSIKGIPIPETGSNDRISDRVKELEHQDLEISRILNEDKKRLTILKQIASSSSEVSTGMQLQFQRTKIIPWVIQNLEKETLCPFCGSKSENIHLQIAPLIESSKRIRSKIQDNKGVRDLFQSEIEEIRLNLKERETQHKVIREELSFLYQSEKSAKQRLDYLAEVYRFVGELEERLRVYKKIFEENEVGLKIKAIEKEIANTRAEIDSYNAEGSLKSALEEVQENIREYASFLEAEKSDNPVYLDINDLTLRFENNSQQAVPLWEIGSGANYMKYHISVILGLHEYFSSQEGSHVGSFIVFDQPSQVYYPDNLPLSDDELSSSDDNFRVRRIFEVLKTGFNRMGKRTQIIVLEHAGPAMWDGLDDDIYLVKRWRGKDENDNALVPDEWMIFN